MSRRRLRRRQSVLPGFGLTLGYTLLYLGLMVLIPLAALLLKAVASPWDQIWATLCSPRVMASFRLSLTSSLAAAVVNGLFGLGVAWMLVRYTFPGKRIIDALVDVPFALPTAVSGIALTTIYAPSGWIGRWLDPWQIKAAFSPLGVTIALTFIGLPFVVRTLQPALEDLDPELEEAAASLGANRWQTFALVILPAILPAWLTGFALAFARALGEYGSVVFIAGNMPMKTEIIPLLILVKLEQYDYVGAVAIASLTLVLSFILLLAINAVGWWSSRRRHVEV